jgi:hypothetical protein
MNILRWTRKVVTSLIGGILATTDSPGTPACKTESLLGQAFAETYKIKLDAAAKALRQIECMTANDPTLDRVDTRVINRIALNGWRKTQEETK